MAQLSLLRKHSPNQPYSAKFKPKTAADKEEKRLARAIMSLEEAAACEGESGIAIWFVPVLLAS